MAKLLLYDKYYSIYSKKHDNLISKSQDSIAGHFRLSSSSMTGTPGSVYLWYWCIRVMGTPHLRWNEWPQWPWWPLGLIQIRDFLLKSQDSAAGLIRLVWLVHQVACICITGASGWWGHPTWGEISGLSDLGDLYDWPEVKIFYQNHRILLPGAWGYHHQVWLVH